MVRGRKGCNKWVGETEEEKRRKVEGNKEEENSAGVIERDRTGSGIKEKGENGGKRQRNRREEGEKGGEI